MLPNEQIVVTGQGNSSQDFVTKRLNPDGSLDTSFGSSGTSVVNFGAHDQPNNMVRQPDGKLVLVGSTDAGGTSHFAVARLNANGTPDTSFGNGGKQTIDFGGADAAYGVAIESDGKIVVAGNGDPDNEMVIARLNPNGSIDNSFGTDGEVAIDFGGASRANAVAIQADGKIVLVGSTDANGGDFAIARLRTNGSLDPSFNGNGKLTLDYGGSAPYELGLGIAIQQNGKIVVMGTGGTGFYFEVTRLLPDGSKDPGFGAGGTVSIGFGGAQFDGDVALQSDGQDRDRRLDERPRRRRHGPRSAPGRSGHAAGSGLLVPRFRVGPSVALPGGTRLSGVDSTTAPGRRIVSYDWRLDLPGNDSVDVKCGPQPVLSFLAHAHPTIQAKLTVTDSSGAQASSTQRFRPISPSRD